jgi:hypothetical protein
MSREGPSDVSDLTVVPPSENVGASTGEGRRSLEEERHSGMAAGFLIFAAIMLVLVGVFNIIDGLVALFNDDWFAVTKRALLTWDFTTWGWINLIMGIVLILAGLGLLRGAMWARVVGVIAAGVNAIAQLSFISAYPLWSVIMIAVDILVIWAITAHGRMLRDYS